ncbi:hypothetical protein D3C71_2195200 [compost metagenome]
MLARSSRLNDRILVQMTRVCYDDCIDIFTKHKLFQLCCFLAAQLFGKRLCPGASVDGCYTGVVYAV